MRVLITGGLGFLGSHTAERLLAGGHDVMVLDNALTGRRDNLAPADRLTVVEGDIRDPETLERCFEAARPEVVLHAAATYKDPEDWVTDATTNVVGTVLVAKAALRHRVRRVVYLQTSLCYGLAPTEAPISLRHRLEPKGSYAVSKTAGEQYLLDSALDVVSFRLANMFGPRNLSGPVPTFFKRLSSGQPCVVMDTRRDFVLVHDLVDLLLQAFEGRGARGVYHAGTGRDFSILELYRAVEQAMGLPARDVEVRPRGPDDVASILLDPSRTLADFGWTARTGLQEGVAQAVAWYREKGVGETYTHLRDKG